METIYYQSRLIHYYVLHSEQIYKFSLAPHSIKQNIHSAVEVVPHKWEHGGG